jgi:Glycosyl transferases group 1
MVAAIGATDVHFLGHVSNEELTAYYELADVLLCASEHEGFCVPLIEAFHMGVPVIAYAAAAVPATMDGAGVLFTEKDPLHVAALVNAVVDDARLRDRIIEGQDAALDRLAGRDFGGTLLGFVDRMLATPRQPHPPVAFDFWDQTRYADELQEIRQYRPSAFLALPHEPEAGSREPGAGQNPGSRIPDPGSRP